MDRASYHLAQLNNVLLTGPAVLSEADTHDDDVICISHTKLTQCSGNLELSLSIRKRFSGKRFRHIRFLADTLVYTCLSSNGYAISHENVRGVDRDLMLYIWEFIQTTTVSSSLGLSDMMKVLVKGRSKEGFETLFRHNNRFTVIYDNYDGDIDEETTWTSIPDAEHKQHATFYEASFADVVLAKALSTDNKHATIESLCLDTLHTL